MHIFNSAPRFLRLQALFGLVLALCAMPAMPSEVVLRGAPEKEITTKVGSHQSTQKSVLISPRTVTWPGGVVPWKYNPVSQPVVMGTDAWLGLIQRTMARWEAVCSVRFEYQGLTTAPAFTDDGVNVVGWSPSLPSYGVVAQYQRGNSLVPEDVTLVSPSDLLTNEWWTKLLKFDEVIEGVLLHELGHLLGLQHSDQPASVLYANPYHPEQGYMRTLKPDDRAGCAALYGTASRQTQDDPPIQRGAVHLLAGQAARVVVAERILTPEETATEPSVSAISAQANAVTVAGFVSGMPSGQTMRVELIAPDGSLYDYRNYPSFARGRLSILINDWRAGYGAATLPGRWTVNVLVGEALKATQSLDVGFTRGTLVNAYPETLLLARPSADNNSATLSALNLAGTTTGYNWAVDGQPVSTDTSFTLNLRSTPTEVQLRARSDQARYVTASNGYPQGDGPDVLRRVVLSHAALAGNSRYSAEVLGARRDQTIRATAFVGQSGAQQVFLIGIAGNTVVFKVPNGWRVWDGQTAPTPYFSTVGPALAQFAIVNSLDLSGLPTGVQLFMGSGSSFNEMIQAKRYSVVAGLD